MPGAVRPDSQFGMELPPAEDTLIPEVWKGSVPIAYVLSEDDLTTLEKPPMIFVRTSLPPALAH